MRLFLAATAFTLVIGFGTVAALADETVTAPGPSYAAASGDVRAPQGGQYVKLDRAFQRLELEAKIEEFYADLTQQAQGLSRMERLELFYDAEEALRTLVLESETYAGEHHLQGEEYLDDARHALAWHVGLDETPAKQSPFS
jgi:hypothetical protein